MGLFENGNCDVCGQPKNILGKKLIDGTQVCAECAKKASFPSIYDVQKPIKKLNKDQFLELLTEREENRERLNEFTATSSFFNEIQVDEDTDEMIFATKSEFKNKDKLMKLNPPIIKISDIIFNHYEFQYSSEKKGVISKYVEAEIYGMFIVRSKWIFGLKHLLKYTSLSVERGLLTDKIIVNDEEVNKFKETLARCMQWELDNNDEVLEEFALHLMKLNAGVDENMAALAIAGHLGYLNSQQISAFLKLYYDGDKAAIKAARKEYHL